MLQMKLLSDMGRLFGTWGALPVIKHCRGHSIVPRGDMETGSLGPDSNQVYGKAAMIIRYSWNFIHNINARGVNITFRFHDFIQSLFDPRAGGMKSDPSLSAARVRWEFIPKTP